jgi:hypothetical protein
VAKFVVVVVVVVVFEATIRNSRNFWTLYKLWLKLDSDREFFPYFSKLFVAVNVTAKYLLARLFSLQGHNWDTVKR